MNEAVTYFRDLGERAEDTVRIYLMKSPLTFTFYRFNNRVVFATYRHRQERGNILALVGDRGGELYDWIRDEWKGLIGAGVEPSLKRFRISTAGVPVPEGKAGEFDPTGGALTIAVKCEPNQNGSYTLKVWKKDENVVLNKFPGNFINPADDSYDLDGTAVSHDGQIVEGIIVVSVPDGGDASDVTLTVSQGGKAIGSDMKTVLPGSPAQLVDLMVTLKAAP